MRTTSFHAIPVKGFILPFVLALLLFVASVLAIWLVINVRDEQLNPKVHAVLAAKHDSVTSVDNLFFAVLGFNAQSETDINQAGQRLYANYLEARQRDYKTTFNFDKNSAFTRQQLAGDKDLLCGHALPQEDCVERAIAHPQELQKLVADNQLLLDRYKSVQTYTRLQNPIDFTLNAPAATWSYFMSAKRLFLTNIALEVSQGNIDAAIAETCAEFIFTRRILAEQDIMLLDKMVLAASTRASLAFISDLVRNRSLTDAQYLKLTELVTPLTDDERSLATVLSREFSGFANVIRDVTDLKNRGAGNLGARFLKYNASLNFAWSFVEANQRASQASCLDFQANKQEIEKRARVSITTYIYNPMGKIPGLISAPAYLQYIESMCDLQGMVRILALQLMIRTQHVGDADIANFVMRAGPGYGNPFTGKPMDWNPANHSLTFQPIAARDTKYFPWPL